MGWIELIHGYGLFTGIGFCPAVTDRRKCELWKSGPTSDALLFSLSAFLLVNPLFYRVFIYALGSSFCVEFSLRNCKIFGTMWPVTAVYALIRTLTYKKYRCGQVKKSQMADRSKGSLYTMEMYSGIQE